MISKGTMMALLVGIIIGLLVPYLIVLHMRYLPDASNDPQCLGTGGRSKFPQVPWSEMGHVKTNNDSVSAEDFPQQSHYGNRLPSEELSEESFANRLCSNLTASDLKLQPKLIPRKRLFVGVITAAKYLDTRATAINNTWGKDISQLNAAKLQFFVSQPPLPNINLPYKVLPGTDDTQYPPQQKVFHMLKYMHDNYINEFEFFMRSDDDVYVKTDQLLELLQSINPAQDIYMGCPGFGRPDDRNRIQLDQNEHYCMGGPGVIFSRSALRKLAPHLDECLKDVVVSYNEDVEVGRCVNRMLKLQCTWAWETSALFWTDYKQILVTEQLYTSKSVKTAITLHPVKDPKLMYRVHQYVQELRVKRLMREVSFVQENIEQTTRLLSEDTSRLKLKKWLRYDISSNPSSRYDISIWEYFNSSKLFLAYEHKPVIAITSRIKTGINSALEALLEIMNEREGRSQPFVPPYHLYDGFVVSDHSSGIEYVLHISVHHKQSADPMDYIANVFLPYNGGAMASYRESRVLLQIVVNIVISVGQSTDLTSFLQMYEQVCLTPILKTHLHIAMFGKNEKVLTQVNQLLSRYSHGEISTYELSISAVSYTEGFSYVANLLKDDDLMVFFDHSFVFTSDFLDHCRMNTIKDEQVYLPILFSFYKPELVQKLQKPSMLISAETGFFLRYNYQVVSIFRSDFMHMNGFADSTQSSNSHLNDDVKFVDKILSTDIYAMRALEPYLRRHYRPRTCKGLSGNAHLACMNSRADAIGSKKILGSLLVSHDLLDKI